MRTYFCDETKTFSILTSASLVTVWTQYDVHARSLSDKSAHVRPQDAEQLKTTLDLLETSFAQADRVVSSYAMCDHNDGKHDTARSAATALEEAS